MYATVTEGTSANKGSARAIVQCGPARQVQYTSDNEAKKTIFVVNVLWAGCVTSFCVCVIRGTCSANSAEVLKDSFREARAATTEFKRYTIMVSS